VKLSRVHYASLITSIEKTKERRAGAKRPRLQTSRAEETKWSNEIKTLRDKHSEELTALKAKQTDEFVDSWATQRLGENRGNESSNRLPCKDRCLKNATASNYWHEVSTLARLSATRPRKERDANATTSTSTTNNNLFMGQRVSIGFAFTTGQLQGYQSNTKL
jgi:hypothetical protein